VERPIKNWKELSEIYKVLILSLGKFNELSLFVCSE